MNMVTKSREFINLNLNCIRTTTLKCKVFDIIICLNHFSINLNFKLKRKSRHDYQIKYAFMAICHVKYPSQKVLHLWLWSTNSRNLKKYRWDKPEQYLTLKDQTIKSRDLRRTMMTHSLKIAGNLIDLWLS